MRVTQQEEKKTQNGMKIKKVRNILLKIIGAIVIAIVLFLGIVYIVNVISSQFGAKKNRALRAARICRREKYECVNSRRRRGNDRAPAWLWNSCTSA